jgi:hypothetical protein
MHALAAHDSDRRPGLLNFRFLGAFGRVRAPGGQQQQRARSEREHRHTTTLLLSFFFVLAFSALRSVLAREHTTRAIVLGPRHRSNTTVHQCHLLASRPPARPRGPP